MQDEGGVHSCSVTSFLGTYLPPSDFPQSTNAQQINRRVYLSSNIMCLCAKRLRFVTRYCRCIPSNSNLAFKYSVLWLHFRQTFIHLLLTGDQRLGDHCPFTIVAFMSTASLISVAHQTLLCVRLKNKTDMFAVVPLIRVFVNLRHRCALVCRSLCCCICPSVKILLDDLV